jgi:hypothetical protein
MNVVRVFFDDSWWQQHLGCPSPGLIGSGCGLPNHPSYANTGYVRKPAPFLPAQWRRDPDLVYPINQEARL